ERKRLREILVKAKGTSERASDLGDLKGMGEPRAEVVALMKDEDLRLMRQAAEGGRMDDAVAVPAEIVAGRARRPRAAAAPGAAAPGFAPDLTHRTHARAVLRPPLASPLRLTRPVGALNYRSSPLAIVPHGRMTMDSVTVSERAARRIAEILGREPAGT